MNHQFDELSRRMFLSRAARAYLGVSLLPAFGWGANSAFAASDSKVKHVIYLMMSGGMTHIDTLDPKPGREEQGPTGVIDTAVPGVKFGEDLPQLAKRMKEFSLIRSMTTNQGAHLQGRYLMRTSYSPLPSIRHPGMGAWITSELGKVNQNIPANVIVSGGSDHPGAGFLDLKYAPLIVGDPSAGLQNSHLPQGVTEEDFQHRLMLLATFGTEFYKKYPSKKVKGYGEMFAEAVRLMKSEDMKAFDISQENEKTREAYGLNKFGQGCLLARRLIEQEVRFVEVEFGGWDTHVENFKTVGEKAPLVDQAVSALLDDLKNRGMLTNTLVVLTSEFGRSPKINDRIGRDHHPAVFTTLLAGCGIKRGYVHGASDERGHSVHDDEVTVGDFNATIAQAMGMQYDKAILSTTKRPFKIGNEGKPVKELFA